ncbi:MAG: acyloxyacyl hydrolase [Bacteroidia bacterium]
MDKVVKPFLFLLLAIQLGSIPAFAGDPGFALYRSQGFLWAHRKTMLPMEAPTRGLDLNVYFFSQQGKQNWTRQYRSPRLGICFTHLNLGNPEISGEAFGILPYAEFKIIDRPRQEFNVRVSSGIGYLTRVWDLETNLLNKAVGSHLNANMRLHLSYHWMIHPKIELSAVFGITHFSNANFKMPNLGLNSVEAGIGLGYHLHGKPKETKTHVPDTVKMKGRHEIRFSGASKVTGLVYSRRVFVSELSYRYSFWGGQKNRLSGGVDVFHDRGYLYRDNPANLTDGPNLANSFETGLVFGNEFLLGSLHILTEGGIYAYSPRWNKGLFYQRLGFKYEIGQHWAASITLKTHFARADYIEWGIAYTILQP